MLDDILTKMNEEKKSHKLGGASLVNAIRDNKKINEMFEGVNQKSKVVNDPSKSAFFTLNDFLDDLNDPSEKSSKEEGEEHKFYIKSKTAGSGPLLHQLSLNNFQKHNVPQNNYNEPKEHLEVKSSLLVIGNKVFPLRQSLEPLNSLEH